MAFNKNIDGYPQQFVQLTEKIWNDPTPIIVTMPSKGEATRLRFKFYDFKKALRLQTSERGQDLCRMAENVVVIIRGNIVEFSSRDHAMDAIAIESALIAMGNVPGRDSDTIQNELDRIAAMPITPTIPQTITPDPQPTPDTQEDLLGRYFQK